MRDILLKYALVAKKEKEDQLKNLKRALEDLIKLWKDSGGCEDDPRVIFAEKVLDDYQG